MDHFTVAVKSYSYLNWQGPLMIAVKVLVLELCKQGKLIFQRVLYYMCLFMPLLLMTPARSTPVSHPRLFGLWFKMLLIEQFHRKEFQQ